MMTWAAKNEACVELEYQGDEFTQVARIEPLDCDGAIVTALGHESGEQEEYQIGQINWARIKED
jgi:hypothetical protein